MLLALALLLGVIGIIISWPRAEPVPPPRKVAIAKQDIPTYTLITPDMVEEKEVPAAEAKGAPSFDQMVGRMSTKTISKGTLMSDQNALSPEQVRYVADPSLEVISFPANFDEVVGGQLKPGQKINVYAYRSLRQTDVQGGRKPEVRLLATDIPVVDVRARSGESGPRLAPTATPGSGGGGGLFGGAGPITSDAQQPGSIVTVAVPPEMALLIVDTMGAQAFDAWVTLSANRAVQITATPSPAPATATVPAATPTMDMRPVQTAVAATATASAASAATATAQARANQPSGSSVPLPSATPGRIPTTGGQKP